MKKHLTTFLVAFAACATALYAYNQYQMRKFQAVAHLIEGLTLASSFKGPVASYFAAEGRFPKTNAEAGLGPAQHYRGQSVTSVAVTAGGSIVVSFSEKSGVAGGTIRLTPAAPHGVDGNVLWECTSPSFSRIETAMSTCKYVPAAAPSTN